MLVAPSLASMNPILKLFFPSFWVEKNRGVLIATCPYCQLTQSIKLTIYYSLIGCTVAYTRTVLPSFLSFFFYSQDLSGYVWDYYAPSLKMSSYLVAFLVSEFNYVTSDPSLSKMKVRVWSRPDTQNQTA